MQTLYLDFSVNSYVIYAGYPNQPRVLKGSLHISVNGRPLTDMQGIQLQFLGLVADRISRTSDRYDESLRNIFHNAQCSPPELPPAYILQVAAKTIKDIIVENRLIE